MAVTKDKFGVPIDGNRLGILQPKLRYRFRVIMTGFGAGGRSDELTSNVVSVTRPTLGYEEVTIDSYNSRAYVQGKHTWEPVTLTLREDANNNVQKIIGQQLQRQFDFFEQSSAVSSGTYKFQTRIEILDGGNGANGANVIDRFQLVGCYLESANYNSLAYATNEAVTTTLSIRYDNAIQFGADESFEGIGETVARASAAAICPRQEFY